MIEAVPYPITVEPGSLHRLGATVEAVAPAHRYAVVSDSTVAPLYAERARQSFAHSSAVQTFTVPAGERHKTRESWARITDEMLAAGFGRDSTVIALGGGVVGDLAGFVAATYMRGVPFVQVPTTLLAMIDASVGGKVGVDTAAGKNLVGAFHQPAAVVMDPELLATLPLPELRAGLAEALKHGVVADERHFDEVAGALPTLLGTGGYASEAMRRLIRHSVSIKAAVVAEDEREGGRRKILNFGHTLGHAVEFLSGYTLLHGEAVAVGMALESELAERLGIAACGTATEVRAALERAGLPTDRPAGLDPERLLAATHADKKARAGEVEYALPNRVGAMAGAGSGWSVRVPDPAVREVLA